MPGYKKTVQDSNPAGFWTFDGEPYDYNSRLYTHSPHAIFDESTHANDGILMVGDDEPNYAYRAGMTSLVAQEPSLQSCFCIGQAGKVNGLYPKALVQIPHIAAYDTKPAHGSYTVALMVEKTAAEDVLRNAEYPNYPFSSTFVKNIFSKPGVFTLSIVDPYYTEDYLTASFPNGTMNILMSVMNGFYGSAHHIVARWSVEAGPLGGMAWIGTAQLIVDGVTVGKNTTQYQDLPPDTTVTTAIELGGTSSGYGTIWDDRATSRTYIDQVAFWPRALGNVEVWRLFKKVWGYQDMVMRKRPTLYIPFEDDPVVNTTAVYTAVAPAGTSTYHTGEVARAKPGPPNIPGSRCALFSRAVHVVKAVTYYGSFTEPFGLDSDNYAFEMWVKTAATSRAVIMSMQGNDKPFLGPLLEINVNSEGGYANGVITYRENELGGVSTPATDFMNNGAFQHIIVQRRAGEYLEIFVNGDLKMSKKVGKAGINAQHSIINLMGAPPGNLYCDGSIAHFAVYVGKTFEEFEASTRYQFTTIYRVRGNTTLRAAPYSARVRLYHYRSGALIDQQDSQAADGSFTFYLKDNSLVTSQILSMNDNNVRVRGFGPITPAELPDPY